MSSPLTPAPACRPVTCMIMTRSLLAASWVSSMDSPILFLPMRALRAGHQCGRRERGSAHLPCVRLTWVQSPAAHAVP